MIAKTAPLKGLPCHQASAATLATGSAVMTANVRRSRNCKAKTAASISARTACQTLASQRHSAAIAAADARIVSLVTGRGPLFGERFDFEHHLALHDEVRQLEGH